MPKFNFEDYRQPWETGPHWQLKKEFMDMYQDNFPEDKLLCLAQAYANIVLMNCSYPEPVMRQVHELSKPLKGCKQFLKMETENSGPQHQEKGKRKSSDASLSKGVKLIKFCVASDRPNPELQDCHIKDEKVSNKNTNLNSSSKHSTSVNTCYDKFEQQPSKIFESSVKHTKINVRLLQHIADEVKKQITAKERPLDAISHAVEILGIKGLSKFTTKKTKIGLQTMYSCDFNVDRFKISSEIDVTPFKAKLKAAKSGVAYFMNPLNFNSKSFTSMKNEDVSERGQQQNNAASKGIKVEDIASPIKKDKSANNTVCIDNKSNAVKSSHLSYIQKYIQEVRNLLAKKVFPTCAIRDAAQNMKITDKIDLQVNMDPKSPKHRPIFNARFSIENHVIASSNGSSKKNARVSTLESAINIMLNPSELVSVLSNVCQQCRDKALEDTFINNMHTSSTVNGSEKAKSDISVNLEQHKISVEGYCHPQEKSGKTEPVISTNSEQIRTSPENNLTLEEMPGKVDPGLSTDPKQQRKNNHNVPKMGDVISYRNNNKQNIKKLCFSDMDDQSLIKILSERLKNITQKNINSYNKILLAVKAANMMDFIKFNTTTNSSITGENLTFCCEFYVRNTLIASGTGLEVKKAMQKACENTLSVLTGESIDDVAPPCETETSLYDAVSSKLKNVSFDCVNKPLFDSSVQRKFVLIDDSEYKLKCDTNPTSVLIASAAFSHKACTYKYETVESGMQQKLIRAEINFDGETVGSGTGTTKKQAKLAAARDTLETLRKKVYTIKVKNQDSSGFTIEPEQLRSAPAVSSALTEDNIGCKMMKMMGWTGGGIGKSSGITEPISVSEHRFGQGLGYVDNKNNNPQMKDFKSRVASILKDYSLSSTTSDLIFSSRFTKEERAEIHKIASRFGVQTSSYGKGNDRYMIVKRRFQVLDLLYLLLQSGGSTEKYELVDRSA